MNRVWMTRLLSACLVLGSLPAFARPSLLSGELVQDAESRVVNDIQWNTSLPAAEAQARREGKMVMWIHMLGDIKGAT
jgi:hypothetical protein